MSHNTAPVADRTYVVTVRCCTGDFTVTLDAANAPAAISAARAAVNADRGPARARGDGTRRYSARLARPADAPAPVAPAPLASAETALDAADAAGLVVTRFGDDVVPPLADLARPGSEAAYPLAHVLHRAYNGHRNIMTPAVLGYAAVGPWVCEVSFGDGIFRDRETGLKPELVGVTVVHRATCKPVSGLSRTVNDRDAGRRYVGALALLAKYRRERAALLAHAVRVGRDTLTATGMAHDIAANRLDCLRHDMAGLRCQYRTTLARFGIEPAPAAPAMVPQPAQQPQSRDARAARYTGPAFGDFAPEAKAAALAWADLASDEAPVCLGDSPFNDGVREGVDKLTRRGVIGDDVGAAILALYEVPAPAMVPQPCQQPQARDGRGPARRGMARSEGDGTWQVGIYSLARNDAGDWVVAATGPGTIGDGYVGAFASWAAAYKAVTGETVAASAKRPVMVPQPAQQPQARDDRGGLAEAPAAASNAPTFEVWQATRRAASSFFAVPSLNGYFNAEMCDDSAGFYYTSPAGLDWGHIERDAIGFYFDTGNTILRAKTIEAAEIMWWHTWAADMFDVTDFGNAPSYLSACHYTGLTGPMAEVVREALDEAARARFVANALRADADVMKHWRAKHAAEVLDLSAGAITRLARMVPQPAQQPQARDGRCPVPVGPSVYEAGASLVARVRAAIGRKPKLAWAAPVVADADAFVDVDVASAEAMYDNPADAPGPWCVAYPDGEVQGYATEAEACAVQRGYREHWGRDAMTGEARA